ncbi:hypothetical protein AB1Y20_013537 [Prymnesium parvum]|uniref:RNA helicase n=1 Tax=Prymnesium parvum TaxID=97485 RepID=A0AB34II50_PRYPA
MPVSLGQRVIIHGLNSKPELNGCEGIAESFDDVKGRYNVRLNTGAVMALRPDNLQVQMTLEEALQEDPVNQEKILSMIDSRSAACPLNNFGQFGLHLALKRGRIDTESSLFTTPLRIGQVNRRSYCYLATART